uniref:Uncharacterized protein n=1 Tax=Rhizophora mucronata TaxID=61149 RepID=A0A2P2KAA3_RHIMU
MYIKLRWRSLEACDLTSKSNGQVCFCISLHVMFLFPHKSRSGSCKRD